MRYVPARVAHAEGFHIVVCTTCMVGHILPLRQKGRASARKFAEQPGAAHRDEPDAVLSPQALLTTLTAEPVA